MKQESASPSCIYDLMYTRIMTTWELLRNWDVVRYIVYYLVEDMVAPDQISGKDVLDFSSGLGDLSEYIYDNHPRSLISTSPDNTTAPETLTGKPFYTFMADFSASRIAKLLPPHSLDLVVARMVFQFPTDENDRIDVDGMLSQFYAVLRPGGTLIICSHEFTQLNDDPECWDLPLRQYLSHVAENAHGPEEKRIQGLIELVETIGLPPREGVHGQTGFGLKGLMAIDSFIQAGFLIESAAEIEDFTFPVGISRDYADRKPYYRELSQKVFAIKKRHILTPPFQDKYLRPQVLKNILKEIMPLHPFVTVPIFKIQATKPLE